MEEDRNSYDPVYFQALYESEERHFWFRARNLIIQNAIRDLIKTLPDGFKAVEIGCGPGNVLSSIEKLCKRGHLIGLDLHYQGLMLARKRVNVDLVVGDISKPPFSSEMSIIGLFDVIEHLDNDGQILEDVARTLVNDGWLLITVPALPALWSYFDTAAHHVRRYTKKSLANLLTRSGFKIEFLSYTTMLTLPIVWVVRLLSRASHKGSTPENKRDSRVIQQLKIIPVINEIFFDLLWLEAQIIKYRLPLPMGSSLIAIARKK